jgi:hypothetical protein
LVGCAAVQIEMKASFSALSTRKCVGKTEEQRIGRARLELGLGQQVREKQPFLDKHASGVYPHEIPLISLL